MSREELIQFYMKMDKSDKAQIYALIQKLKNYDSLSRVSADESKASRIDVIAASAAGR